MSKRIENIRQLDSLRTIAAFMVIFHHFLRDLNIISFPFGAYGVEIFFTISGFLITAILLKQREVKMSNKKKIRNFIIKRVLRLFPVYYLVLIFFSILSFFGLYVWDQGYWVFYYTYTTNILFFFKGMQGVQLNHVWTLAVEEQFYLLWPLVILLVSRKILLPSILFLITASLIFKSIDITSSRMLTIYHFDTLGLGALLALVLNDNGRKSQYISSFFRIFPSNLVLFLLFGFIIFNADVNFIIIDLLSLLLVVGCIKQYWGLMGKLMDSNILVYLGRISYGLYIYHKPIPYFINIFCKKMDLPPVNPYLLLCICLALTVMVSHLSFVIIERRMIRLKDRFDF